MADKLTFIDGFSLLPDGMNSGVEPQLIPKTQTAFSTNATHRGGVIGNRPGFRKVTLDFQGDALVQQRFENALWQGGTYFKSEYGSESLVVSIGGRIFEVVPNPDASLNSAKVYERTINGDTNSAGVTVASLWQAERWVIINDNESLPIFFDGATARRSYGSSQDIGLAAADFTIPAIGESVDVTLVAPYTGPVNYSVYVDDVFYQVNASVSGPSATIKNLSESGSPVQPVNTQLIIPSNLLSQTVDLQASGTSGGINVLLVKISDLPNPPLAVGEILTVRISGTNYVSAPITQIFDPQRVFIGPVPVIPSCPALSPVYRGYFSSAAVAGVLASSFTTPILSASGTAILQAPYYGPLPQKVVINGGLFEITAVNNNPSLGNVINITNINDTFASQTRGPSGSKGVGQFMTIPELPVGNVGQYGMGRNVMSLPDRRSFLESDLVGGSSGSPAYNYRDAVLKVTENEFLFGGGSFSIPGNVGDIQSMTFPPNLDTSLGQGPLQIGTPSKFFSCQVPTDRTVWESMTNPLLTVSLSGKGSLGQYGTIAVNSDTYFRALNGIGSLVLARRDFNKPGNTPISREMQRVIDADNIELLNHSTAVEFDNRVLMGCLPTQGPLGVYHQGIIVQNLDPVSSLRGKAPEIYDGLWTGLQAFQFISGKFSGDERAFAFCFETFTNKIVLMELRQSGEDEFDNSTTPITWGFETASLFKDVKKKGDFDEVELVDGELWVSHIQGVVNIQTWYRPDYSECWIPWHSFSVCGTPNDPKQYRPRLGLGEPDVKKCDPVTNRPFRIGATFQLRVQITGACKVRGGFLKATPVAEPYWAPMVCTPLCDQDSTVPQCEPCKEQGECLRFDLVFYNINGNKTYSNDAIGFAVECPNGTTETVVIPAGEIFFTLPFPPGYEGEYPPLVLGCAVGGRIVREIPSGSTQEEIDAIVAEMINTCAESLAQSRATCQGAAPQVSNEEVYFDNPCEEGELAYSGTLPSWITLDTENQRLVGSSGIFKASTQAEANAIAQDALDSFGNNAVVAGDLFCETECPTPSVFPTVNLPVGADPLSMETDSLRNKIWITDGLFGGNLSVYVLDAETNTLETTINVTAHGGIWQLVYDSVNEQMVGIANNGDMVFFNTTSYAIEASIPGLLHSNAITRNPLAYDSDAGNILAVDINRVSGTRNVRLISGATRSQIASNDQLVTLWSPVYIKGFGQFAISIVSDSTVRLLNSTTLAMSSSAIVFPNTQEYMRWAIFDQLTNLVFANTRDSSNRGKVRVVDFFSDSIVGTLSGADVPANQWSIEAMVINSCTGILCLNDFSRLFTFSTSTFSQLSSVSKAGADALAHSRLSNLVYVGINANNVIETV